MYRTNSEKGISLLSSRRAKRSNSKRRRILNSFSARLPRALGYYSVHTAPDALRDDEAHIAAIRTRRLHEGHL
jgi:hypothetical protein